MIGDIETRMLERMPKLDDIVSDANPIPYREWLPQRCDVRDQTDIVTFYGVSNCNYLVYRDRVFANYGYHGRNLFRTLNNPVERLAWFTKYVKNMTEIEAILGHPLNPR